MALRTFAVMMMSIEIILFSVSLLVNIEAVQAGR